MKGLFFKVLLVASFLLPCAPVFATEVGGIIDANTTWDEDGSPYVVTSSIIIGDGATLTIDPNVEVKFDPDLAFVVGSASWGGGDLVARGTEELPIIFTSVKDPCDACDPAAPGDWSRIHFTDYVTDAIFDSNGDYESGCILEHVIVEYAGHGDYAAITAELSSPFLNYCEVRHNSSYGIKLAEASSAILQNNNVHDNLDSGIYFDAASGNTLTGNTITGNTASDYGGGVYFDFYSSNNTLIENTISDNTATGGYGGGIYICYSSDNTLTENTITGNTACYGGGIYFDWYSENNTLTENAISGNTASCDGGGIYFHYSDDSTMTGNDVKDNNSTGEGGAIYFYCTSNSVLSSNAITNNQTDAGQTGGIYVTAGSEWLSLAGDPCEDTYNIIWDNDGYQLYNNNAFTADGRNDVNAPYVLWGTGDIQKMEDAIFDFFDDSTKAFVVFLPFALLGDFDMDEDVDFTDYAAFANHWRDENCIAANWCEGSDFNKSGEVDIFDFRMFAKYWLAGVEP